MSDDKPTGAEPDAARFVAIKALQKLDRFAQETFGTSLAAMVQSEQLRLLQEVHEAVVGKAPGIADMTAASVTAARLVAAARRVVEARYRQGGEWEELSEAIRELGDVLEGK